MKQINDSNFESEVLKNEKPVLVDFWASWCGPCRALAPVFEEVSTKFEGKVDFVKVNVDEASETPTKYGIRSIPTLILFKNGEAVETISGSVSSEQIEEFVNKHTN